MHTSNFEKDTQTYPNRNIHILFYEQAECGKMEKGLLDNRSIDFTIKGHDQKEFFYCSKNKCKRKWIWTSDHHVTSHEVTNRPVHSLREMIIHCLLTRKLSGIRYFCRFQLAPKLKKKMKIRNKNFDLNLNNVFSGFRWVTIYSQNIRIRFTKYLK